MALWLRVLVALPEDQGSMVHNSITFNLRQRYSVTLMEQYKSHDQTQTKAEALSPRSDPSYSCTSSAFVLFIPSSPREEPSQLIAEQPILLGSSCSEHLSLLHKSARSQNPRISFSLCLLVLLATNQQTQFGSSLAVFPVVFG